jgi:hypothetical protein
MRQVPCSCPAPLVVLSMAYTGHLTLFNCTPYQIGYQALGSGVSSMYNAGSDAYDATGELRMFRHPYRDSRSGEAGTRDTWLLGEDGRSRQQHDRPELRRAHDVKGEHVLCSRVLVRAPIAIWSL